MMKKKLIAVATLLCCFGIVIAAVADLNGKWSGQVDMNGQPIPLSYTFKVDGDKLTGSEESPYGNTPIDNGKVTGDTFSFSTNIQGMEINHTGKFYGDSVGLDAEVQSQKLHSTLKRVK